MKKIRIISAIMVAVMLISACNLGMMFISRAADVTQIEDIQNIIDNSTETDVNIKLTSDIDASDLDTVSPIDAKGKKIIFDGNNKLIKNLTIIGSGLFVNLGASSSISNLGMYNCNIIDISAENKQGFGFITGKMASGTIENCFAHGNIAVYGGAQYIGGLVGQFGGTMTNSFALTEIYTDGSYVGGLIGQFTGDGNTISACYSTGSIDNQGTEYIGGLIGQSDVPCVSNSYTTTFIRKAGTERIKSIGNIKGLADKHNVYYDENISIQKQGDADPHRCLASEIGTKLSEVPGSLWVMVGKHENSSSGVGYYPQLSVFYNGNDSFKRISAISAAIVDITRVNKVNTGRDFTVLTTSPSNKTGVSYAILTNSVDTTGDDPNRFMWKITGGVDEYYFEFDSTIESGIPTNTGGKIDGLAGNTFDVTNGKYLFVNTGDVKFTASSGEFERDIYVHVTEHKKNPYFGETKEDYVGKGTSAAPYIINSIADFDALRLYCLDDKNGDYYYKFDFSNKIINLSENDVPINWVPIVGMKGTLIGNDHKITNLNVTQANEGDAGFFANISTKADISGLHISNANIKPKNQCSNAGIIAGRIENATVKNVILNGIVEGCINGGIMAGKATGSVTVNEETLPTLDTCVSYGIVSATEAAGGMFGITDENILSLNCLSTAVVIDGKHVGGFYGVGGGDVDNCVFGGNLSSGYEKHGLVDSGNANNSYFDWQAAGIHNSTSDNAKDTDKLTKANGVTLDEDSWDWVDAGRGVIHYPQLNYFKDTETLLNETKRSAAIASLAFDYYDGTSKASSISFNTVQVSKQYENGNTVTTLTPYGSSISGSYTITSNDTDFVDTIMTDKGGKQIYSFTASNESYPCDTRYVLFNVRTIDLYYKFTFVSADEKTKYNSDMANQGLVNVESELGTKYGHILDTSINGYVIGSQTSVGYTKFFTLAPAGDKMTVSMTQAAKYGYQVDVYADSDGNKLVSQNSNEISITNLDVAYINIIIATNAFDWGIYRMNCSGTVTID